VVARKPCEVSLAALTAVVVLFLAVSQSCFPILFPNLVSLPSINEFFTMNIPQKLSIVIPVYNEERYIHNVLERVQASDVEALGLATEIIVVNDCSKDGTATELERYTNHETIRVFHHTVNQGKGAALRTGFGKATGDIILIQDADFEYDPADYPKLLQPILSDKADVVFGSRFAGGEPHRVLYFWHSVGNKFLTLLSNMLTDINLTDMETCYKVFRAEILRQITVRENRFGFEPEITAKVAALARNGACRIYEVGISYNGRTYAEGKKITWKDGFAALKCIIKYNLFAKG
jgi:glycosyltransferase involved in cell wall biosynthesis